MKKFISLLLVLCLIVSVPVEAKSKYKKVGYEYRYVKIKVKYREKKYLGKFTITHYCPCESCCGVGGGKITASGTTPKAGRTVGVNPSVIPYGTKLKIGSKYGYVAEDTGGGLEPYHIDVFVNSHQEAIEKGVQYKKVWVVKTKYKKKKVKVRVPIYEKR